MMNHDIIVIGGSAGGFQVVLELLTELPRDFPATIFLVLHRPQESPLSLAELLSQRGQLPVRHPLHQERTQPGHVYVAPPDNQMWLRPGSVEVVRGPKENGHRPSVDALFRTAAVAYGPRVVGVVLSGHQDCGTAGMLSIKARGGISVVQAPDTASAPDMPHSVLRSVHVDHIIRPEELPALLIRLASSHASNGTKPDAAVEQLEGSRPGVPAPIVCPICQGALSEAQTQHFEHFRCHVGHTFTMDALVREQSEAMERALWAAVRALDEGAELSRRLSTKEAGDLRERFSEKAVTQRTHADVIRGILLHGSMLSQSDSSRG